MRDIAFSLVLAALSAIGLVNPFAGLLSWAWISFALPASTLWGFATLIPANLIIAVSTIIGSVLSSKKLTFQVDRTFVLLVLLAGITALSTALSLSPEVSLPKFKEYTINFAFLIMALLCLNSKIRIDAFVWMMVFCIGYYSIRGGIIFLISGGAFRFEGPVGSSIGDNNHLAAAFLLAIPLINYLRLHAANRMVRNGLAGLLVLTILAVLCTQSRGGFIGLVVLAGAFWWMSGRRISHAAAGLAILGLAVALASDALVSRLQTIESAHQKDTSFLSRVVSWQMHTEAALDRPLVGAGPYAIQTWQIFGVYRPKSPIVDIRLEQPVAAHSIYFQILGDLGFVALGLYFALLWTAWQNATFVNEADPAPRDGVSGLTSTCTPQAAGNVPIEIQRAKDRPDQLWMVNLASMTRVSLVTFMIAGAAVSMAFYDYFLAILALSACLRNKLLQLEGSEATSGRVAKRRTGGLRQQTALTADHQA